MEWKTMKKYAFTTLLILAAALLVSAFIIDLGDNQPTPVPITPAVFIAPVPTNTPVSEQPKTSSGMVDGEWAGPTPTSPTDDPAFWWTPTPEAYP